MADYIRKIKNEIAKGNIDKARELLRDALKNPNAETYNLASQVALNEQQRVSFLNKEKEFTPIDNSEKSNLEPIPMSSQTDNKKIRVGRVKTAKRKSVNKIAVIFTGLLVIAIGLAIGGYYIYVDDTYFVHPTWSRNGYVISYVTDQRDEEVIYVASSDGTNRRRLTNFDHDGQWNMEWSPSGNRIAYTSSYRNRASEIFVINSDGSNQQMITIGYDPSWSLDELTIIYANKGENGSSEIFAITLSNKNIQQLTFSDVNEGSPRVSPDGQYIIFHSEDGIYRMDYNGANSIKISDIGREPFWSSDSQQIVFEHQEHIYTMDNTGNNIRAINSWGINPTWYGEVIAFSNGRGLGSRIYVMNSDGGNIHRLISHNFFDWLIRLF